MVLSPSMAGAPWHFWLIAPLSHMAGIWASLTGHTQPTWSIPGAHSLSGISLSLLLCCVFHISQ